MARFPVIFLLRVRGGAISRALEPFLEAGMLGVEDIGVRLLSYGPAAEVELHGERVRLEPDVLIALEGIGTFMGVSMAERYEELLRSGRDLGKTVSAFHRESTRRGHASLATSLMLQFEVGRCSRVASMLLVSPAFGSYLQESQRRSIVRRGGFFVPSRIAGNNELRSAYSKAIEASYEAYSRLVDEGVELEDARYILPLASTVSLFMSGSLETFLGLLVDAWRYGRDSPWYPEELSVIGEKIGEAVRSIAPLLTEARLRFRVRLPTYPYANPYREAGGLVESFVESHGAGNPVMLSFISLIDQPGLARESLEDPAKAHALSPLIQAIFLEPMSLAAYHQAIRHRTVPTAVESIYSAAERCVLEPEQNLIIPPKIAKDERLVNLFMEAAASLLETYEKLIESGAYPSDAVYLIPQATRIYAVRSYNGFNLLWPQGFIATRTCSTSQWEVRRIAYEIWRQVGEKARWLGELIGEKCRHLGYCPERKWCPIILKYRSYDDEEHKGSLENGER
jgi:thymidylate synthase (FAD)